MKDKQKRKSICPECKGELIWLERSKVFVCLNCGLELNPQEKISLEIRKEENSDSIKDYVKWWLSKKD